MKTISRNFALLSLATTLFAGINQATAQDQPQPAAPAGQDGGQGGGRRQGGNFDPAQMRQRMMERMKEQFGVTNDDEWKIISERIEKVTEARRASGAGINAFGFGGGRGGGRPPGGQDGAQGGGQGGNRGGRGFGAPASPEAEDLQKALDANASPEDIKAKLAKLRESRKANEEKLKDAQSELKEVLNTKQEAVAVLMGLLP